MDLLQPSISNMQLFRILVLANWVIQPSLRSIDYHWGNQQFDHMTFILPDYLLHNTGNNEFLKAYRKYFINVFMTSRHNHGLLWFIHIIKYINFHRPNSIHCILWPFKFSWNVPILNWNPAASLKRVVSFLSVDRHEFNLRPYLAHQISSVSQV